MKRLALSLALVVTLGGCARAAAEQKSFEAPCADPLVTLPGVAEPFRPGGPDFTVLVIRPGEPIIVDCSEQVAQ